ncbi:fibronectin type III-like domain-contianing protein, partial [Bacteroides caccae]
FKVNRTTFNADDELIFEVDVKNVGERAGKETVLLYSSDLAASVSPDVIRLRNFEKVELQSGETKKVVMKLKGSDLAFVGQDRKWRLEQGRFRMKCGSEILYIDCEKDKIWDTPNID